MPHASWGSTDLISSADTCRWSVYKTAILLPPGDRVAACSIGDIVRRSLEHYLAHASDVTGFDLIGSGCRGCFREERPVPSVRFVGSSTDPS